MKKNHISKFIATISRYIVCIIGEIPVVNSFEKRRRQNRKKRLMYLFLKESTSKKDKIKITEDLLSMDFYQMKEDEWEVVYTLSREAEPSERRIEAKNRMKEMLEKEKEDENKEVARMVVN